MQYHLNEGSFSLHASDWLDNSMNVLRDEANGISVIVSRGPVPDESDFEREFHQQWDRMRAQMTSLVQSDFRRVSVGSEGNIRGVEVTSHFERNGQQLYQHQLALQAKNNNTLMVFTYSALRPFTAEDDIRWNTLKNTLSLTPPGQDA
ncbi:MULTISPECIES: DcrB-related protein [unclassified Erwinia]|uniref:DcrB-related protein n=1 Tax=unclassified Erwinia TaxID=2622719 RepID=UPI00082C5712|nr:DcrB-related protein [Erwinia sp. ErVv1]